MANQTVRITETSEAAIFARFWEPGESGLTPALAKYVLKLKFSEDDTSRMRFLAEKNRAGTLSRPAQEELDNFLKVGDLIAVIQSKASS